MTCFINSSRLVVPRKKNSTRLLELVNGNSLVFKTTLTNDKDGLTTNLIKTLVDQCS